MSVRPRRSSQSTAWRRIADRQDSPLSAVVRQAESHRGVTGLRRSHREGVTRLSRWAFDGSVLSMVLAREDRTTPVTVVRDG
jgi:hypothetical protein